MISVCMATYNGGKYIKEQLESILCQLSKDDEVIISDDGSTDDTLSVVEGLHDSRIKVYHFRRDKKGIEPVQLITTNFENALNHANGDFIFLSDQDDVWLPNKMDVMLSYLQNYDYVVSDCFITDSELNVKSNTRFYAGSGFTKNRWKALFVPTPYQGSCAGFKRKILDKALPFPKGIQSHDRWIGYIASFFYSYIILPDSLILYRRHEENSSTATQKSGNGLWVKVKIRLKYIIELLKLIIK